MRRSPKTASPDRPAAPARGAVLLIVLWLLAALAVLTASLAYAQRVESRVAGRFRDHGAAYFAARGGVEASIAAVAEAGMADVHHLGMSQLFGEARYKEVALGRTTYSVYADPDRGGRPRFGLVDEESRVNVNTAPLLVLARLPGMTLRLAEGLLALRKARNAALGRRDPSDPPPGGASESAVPVPAEAGGDRGRGRPPERPPVDLPFRDVADLLEVPGMTPERLAGTQERPGIARFVSTRSSGAVNVNTACAEVLTALGVERSVALGMEARRSSAGGYFADVPAFLAGAGLQDGAAGDVQELLAVRSTCFRVLSVGRIATGPGVAIEAALATYGGSVHVLSWTTADVPPDGPPADGAMTREVPR